MRMIDQSKCKKTTRKNGDAATFCDLVLIETPDGEYGDYMVKQDTSKEDRQAGVKMPIIGNGKIRGQKPQGDPCRKPAPPSKRPPADADPDAAEDDIPF